MEETKKLYRPGELTPFKPIHPGEMLNDEIKARGITQRKFADVLGCSYYVVNEVVNGKRPISVEMALKIEAALGTPAYIWQRLQADYDMQVARKDSKLSALLKRIQSAAAML